MNWEQLEGEWTQAKGAIKSKWAKLTNDDLAALEARKDSLVGKIQERYGILKEAAEKQVDEWISALPPSKSDKAAPPPEDINDIEDKTRRSA